jgi:hypothetical protein
LRAYLLATVLCLAAACAGAPPVRPEEAPSRVVVLASSQVPRPPPQSITGQVAGSEEPRDVVARAGAEALRSRGFEVVAVETALGPVPTVEQAGGLARRYGVEGTVLLVLTRMELSALRPLGQAELELETSLVDAEGRVLWSGAHRGATAQNLYRARTDWRSHVRQAVISAVRELP